MGRRGLVSINKYSRYALGKDSKNTKNKVLILRKTAPHVIVAEKTRFIANQTKRETVKKLNRKREQLPKRFRKLKKKNPNSNKIQKILNKKRCYQVPPI